MATVMDEKPDKPERLEVLEKKVKRLETLFQQMESRTNRKMMAIMNHLLYNQNSSEKFRRPGLMNNNRPTRNLSRPGPRERFIIPEVTYGDGDENENDNNEAASGSKHKRQRNDSDDVPMEQDNGDDYEDEDEDGNGVDSADDEENNDGEENLQISGDPLAVEDEDGDDDQVEPWRFLSNENDVDDEEEDGENEDDAELDYKPYPFDIEAVEPPEESQEAYQRKPTGLNFRERSFLRTNLTSARSNVIPRLFIPRNRYLMSPAAKKAAEQLQQKLASSIGEHFLAGSTTISPVKPATSSAPKLDTEKVYQCDRCPLTFTLSTRHAHFELHKKMDLKNGGNSSNSNSRQLNFIKARPSRTTIVSVSEVTRAIPGSTTRKRARKVCPVCPRSYSRNQYLRNHLTEHAEEYPYICKECFCVFTNPNDFKKHCQTSERCLNSVHVNT